ncbi:nuclear transport factor 2-like [Dysidea avara]|uniref:nuclear transport factor 2-like n=1 Tax=Dysidea avara TaxID=196820 RepID=UPI003333857F
MAVDAEAIANQFVQSYYAVFDSNRSQLAAFYTEQSILSFEGTKFQGPQAIGEKLKGLPFTVVQHAVSTIDAQINPAGLLLVHVVGQLKTDSDPVHGFSESFLLQQIGDSLFIINDAFRLSLHHQ